MTRPRFGGETLKEIVVAFPERLGSRTSEGGPTVDPRGAFDDDLGGTSSATPAPSTAELAGRADPRRFHLNHEHGLVAPR
jgi:hypothetical protein